MLRVSDCKYLVAMMYESTIEIQKTNIFLEANVAIQQVNKNYLPYSKNFDRKENWKQNLRLLKDQNILILNGHL